MITIYANIYIYIYTNKIRRLPAHNVQNLYAVWRNGELKKVSFTLACCDAVMNRKFKSFPSNVRSHRTVVDIRIYIELG